MKTCKEFQDLILTDYFDEELDKESKGQIEAHLLGCLSCRSFAEQVQKDLVTPFKNIVSEEVPNHIWLSVKKSVEKENDEKVGVEDFLARLIGFFSFPQFLPVLGVFILAIFIGSMVFRNEQIKQAKEKEQVEYLAYLFNPINNVSDIENVSESSIEKYFL